MFKKENILFIVLGGFFITNALVAEFIGVKLFALEPTLGFDPWEFRSEGPLVYTAGNILWPVAFILTDIVNEYFGKKGVRLLSYFTAALVAYAFLMVWLAIQLVPAEFWVSNYQAQGVDNMQAAYAAVFGQGLWIIVGSLVAFLIGQLVDVTVFQWLRKKTGKSKIWLRATGSTLVSQLIDSFVVLYIAFVLPGLWGLDLFVEVGINNYIYKFIIAIGLTPVLYLIHGIIDHYLGKARAQNLINEASAQK